MEIPLVLLATAPDPFVRIREQLDEMTTFPYYVVQVLVLAAVLSLTHGTVSAGKHLAKKNKWKLLSALVLAFGVSVAIWWTPTLGVPIALIALAILIWRPVVALFRGARRAREWNEGRREKRAHKKKAKRETRTTASTPTKTTRRPRK